MNKPDLLDRLISLIGEMRMGRIDTRNDRDRYLALLRRRIATGDECARVLKLVQKEAGVNWDLGDDSINAHAAALAAEKEAMGG